MKRLGVIGRISLMGLIAAAFLVAPQSVQAIDVSGPQTGIWTAANSPYLVTGDIVVPAGQSLTIEPGVQVRFTTTGQRFEVHGTLTAIGVAANPISFQGSRLTPVAGEWLTLAFRPGSSGTLSHCSLIGGGSLSQLAPMILVESPAVTIQDCLLERSDGPGLVVAGLANTALFERITIRDSRFAAIVQTTADMAPRYAAITMTGNGRNGVVLPPGQIPPLLRLNGPAQLNGSPFFVDGPLTVQSGQTLSVTAGTVLQFAIGAGLEVSGTIAVEGSLLNPVRFTTSALTPAPGSWQGIHFHPPANGRLSHCIVEYAGIAAASRPAVGLNSAAVELRHCLINRSGWHGIGAGVGGTLDGVVVRASLGYAIVQTIVDLGPTYRNVTFLDNVFNAVRIPGGGFIRDRILNGGSGLNGAPFFIDGSVNIQAGSTVTLTAGTRLGLAAGATFEVMGRLVADGTLAQPVEIVSGRRLTAPGDWQALRFRPGSSGRLSHCSIASGGGSPAASEISIESSAVIINDCAIRTSLGDGIRIEGNGTSPTLERLFLGRNQGAAIRLTLASQAPVARNLVFFENGINGIVSPGGTTLLGRTAQFTRLGGGVDRTVWTLLPLGPTNTLGEGDLYAGGGFRNAGTGSASFVARWSAASQQWTPAGGGTNGPVRSLVRRPAGAGLTRLEGEVIYAGGTFTVAGGTSANNIAQYDPATLGWAALGSGTNGPVSALVVDGNNVFVGGQFSQAGGQTSSNFAVWDSAAQGWNAIGDGPNGAVATVAVDGSTVFVGGSFSAAGGVTGTSGVAGYNSLSGSWSALAGGVDGTVNAIVAVGGLVYVGGSFSKAGSVTANNIAVWDSQTGTWSALGAGVNGPVFSLSYDPSGLLVGGSFSQAGGEAAANLAMYDGATWHPMSSGTNDTVYSVVQTGSSVAVGGAFTSAGGETTGYITRFGSPRYGLAIIGVGGRG